MYATGEQKAPQANKRLLENLEARKRKTELFYQGDSKATSAEAVAEDAEAGEVPEATVKAESDETESVAPQEAWQKNNRALKFLLKDVKRILQNNPRDLSAKEKKQLRLFRADAKRFLSHPEDSEVEVQELIEELQLQMKSHELLRESFEKLGLKESEPTTQATEVELEHNTERQVEKGLEGLTEEQKEKAKRIMGASQLSRDEMRKLAKLLKYDEENPVDDNKPYATPWRPRAFMPAFAFIPRYLEVNPNICAAVYLRHPVARKGSAEVPTPFSYLTNQLTHNWYLERG